MHAHCTLLRNFSCYSLACMSERCKGEHIWNSRGLQPKLRQEPSPTLQQTTPSLSQDSLPCGFQNSFFGLEKRSVCPHKKEQERVLISNLDSWSLISGCLITAKETDCYREQVAMRCTGLH